MYRARDNARVTVPFHRKDLPKGTLYTIMKSAGLL
ncbi:MAG: type II toxin-antitoxin system HicA family toxin [Candidatus Yonathbacteria bacterium]|nr:type II toxin-antitoxin system HicA family toxin [Candidatus Yonathbacteria bacterium]